MGAGLRHLLLLLPPFAVYAMYTFAEQNGTIPRVKSTRATGILPDEGNAPLQTTYTGIPPIDGFLAETVIGFWAIGRGTVSPHLLTCVLFLGAMVPAWILLLLELARRSTPLRAVWSASLLGFIAQIIGPGILVPAYAAWHLFIIQPSHSCMSEDNLRFVQTTVPMSVFLGGILPFASLLIPTPSFLSYDTKQHLIVTFQTWPFLVSGLILLLLQANPRLQSGGRPHSGLGSVYLFALTVATASHLGVYVLSASSVLFPSIYFNTDIHPLRLLIPTLPWSGVQASSIEEGIFWLLQWDYSIACGSMLLWAMEQSSREKGRDTRHLSCSRFALRLLLLTVICGPCGAAVKLMWERETAMIERKGGNDGQSARGKRHVA